MVALNSQTAVLALGGGGARGIAHLGVIEVLKSLPIDIQRFVGVSIGSLAGALCAVDNDLPAVQKRVIDYLTSEEFQSRQAALFSAAPEADEPATSGMFAWYHQIRRFIGARRKLALLFNQPSLLPEQVIRDVVDALLPDIDLCDLKTPLSIVALDLYSGQRVILREGRLREAVIASAAIPGVFPPVRWGSMLLCDIGMMDAVPSRIAGSYGADLTIAVEVGATPAPVSKCHTATDILLRLSDIGEPLVRDYSREYADLLICPDVSHQPWYDFSDPEALVELGRAATRELVIPSNQRRKPADFPPATTEIVRATSRITQPKAT